MKEFVDRQVGPHFLLGEFKCHDHCGGGEPVQALVDVLEAIRSHFDAPVHINSGYRCPAHNTRIHGAKNSQHVLNTAADITVTGHTPGEVYRFCDTLIGNNGGVGSYPTFTHVDVRGTRARWKG